MDPIIILLVCIAVFFLGRKLILWYYKIDQSIALQKETVRLLKKIAGEPEETVQADSTDDESDERTPEQKLEDYNKRLYGN